MNKDYQILMFDKSDNTTDAVLHGGMQPTLRIAGIAAAIHRPRRVNSYAAAKCEEGHAMSGGKATKRVHDLALSCLLVYAAFA